MDEFPNYLVPENKDNFNKHYEEQYTSYVRVEILDFMLNQKEPYFDFTNFFDRNNIKSEDNKKNIIEKIISELKANGWSLGKLFGGTSILIESSDEALEKSIWANSLDFEKC